MRIPTHIVAKANKILEAYARKEVRARKSNKYSYLVIEVGRNYRLLNKGVEWELMSHQQYNKVIDR